MPKGAHSDAAWERRLAAFAKGQSFGKGQVPRKNTTAYTKYLKICLCPCMKTSAGQKTVSGNEITCTCGFHKKNQHKVPVSPTALADAKRRKSLKEQNSVALDGAKSSDVEPSCSRSLAPDLEAVVSPEVTLPSTICLPTINVLTQHDGRLEPTVKEPADRILASWKQILSNSEAKFIGSVLFDETGDFISNPSLWYYPPPPKPPGTSPPLVDTYFLHRLLVWMPRRKFRVKLMCNCGREFTSKGTYRTIRKVLDVDEYYNLVTEYYECRACKITRIGWSDEILKQLPVGIREQFPVILTHKAACDIRVITFLRSRTIGNSPTALANSITEQHHEKYLKTVLAYFHDCDTHKKGIAGVIAPPTFSSPPPFPATPTYQWMLRILALDVLKRLPELKAQVTSIYGRVLKLDSTKKIVGKIAGHTAGTAQWCTNVGNEHGQVLMSVVTVAEGRGLEKMAKGIVDRYAKAEVEEPVLLYVDRDCCVKKGKPGTLKLFHPWESTVVRLDIFHYLKRFKNCCTTESHPLFASFMGCLSGSIFEYDSEDLSLLRRAKKLEMQSQGFHPTLQQIDAKITKSELSSHCRRRTVGAAISKRKIDNLIESMKPLTDRLGVPLFDHTTVDVVWSEQQKHLECIQDLPSISLPLYTVTGHLKKGGLDLPVYRCSRGSSSLESFHLHLNRFIPGSSANATNFQMYLLEGLARWNLDRTVSACYTETSAIRCHQSYDFKLKTAVDNLSVSLLGKKTLNTNHEISAYTGELIGIEYLFDQTGKCLQISSEENDEDVIDMEEDHDEGFSDEIELTIAPLCHQPSDAIVLEDSSISRQSSSHNSTLLDEAPDPVTVPSSLDACVTPILTEGSQIQEVSDVEMESGTLQAHQSEPSVDSHGVEGFSLVEDLVEFLMTLPRGRISISHKDKTQICHLYNALHEFDKQRTSYCFRAKDDVSTSTYKVRRMSSVVPGVTSTKRSFIGKGVAASHPNCNRICETLCQKLFILYPRSKKIDGRTVTPFSLVLSHYTEIQTAIESNDLITGATNIVLPPLNLETIKDWYNKQLKAKEVASLKQGAELPHRTVIATTPFTPPLSLPAPLPSIPVNTHEIAFPLNTSTEATSRSNRTNERLNAESTSQGQQLQLPNQSRSAMYRELQKTNPPGQRGRYKSYSCKLCGQAKKRATGHSQYKNKWYCPTSMKISLDEWKKSFIN